MTRKQTAAVAAILTTLAETPGHTMPASYPYLALGCDMNEHQIIVGALAAAGMVTTTTDTITATAKGLDIARQINAALAAA